MTLLPHEPSGPRERVHILNLLPVAMGVIAVLLALSFFGKVASALLAITLAIILATALNPAARFLERWLPRPAAGLLTVLLALAAVVLLGFLTIPPTLKQLGSLSGSVPATLPDLEAQLNRWVDTIPAISSVLTEDSIHRLVQQASTFAGKAARSVPNVVGTLVGGLFLGLVTLAMVVFALSSPVPLVNGVLGAVPPRHRLKAARALAQVLKQLGAWGRATVLIMLVTGAFMAVGLLVLGVDNWLIFGLLAALGELVPNIGPIVATLPPILFTLVDDPQKALYVAVFALVFQQLEGFILAPFLLGGAGKLHPLSVTVGVLLFGGVFGIVGAFLTVPFLIIIKAIYQEFYLQDAPDIPDAVAMALISGKVEEQLDREKEAQAATEKALQEARDAELTRQAEQGELDLQAVLEDPAPDTPTEPKPPQS
ncbi:AI-2E family transporter [Deinococcus cavernae]|uniref:AI-2E family transporter n=1 Tax=Deinococcus cavernae TaxID=2320857 RepID=A0A418V582_9DEIO|nr:AI-2E family transporter [Deinococcus cavernae]RJF71262.1 AI-2E family transporter [Deinococcus cavernae]